MGAPLPLASSAQRFLPIKARSVTRSGTFFFEGEPSGGISYPEIGSLAPQKILTFLLWPTRECQQMLTTKPFALQPASNKK